MELERSITTSQPASNVFNYLAQFHRVVEWDPSVPQAEKITPGVPALDTEFAVDVEFLGSVSILRYRIVEYSPPTRLVLQGRADLYTVTDTITLSAQDTNTTVLHYQVNIDYSPAMQRAAPLLAPLVRCNVDAAIATLERTLNQPAQPIRHYPVWRDKAIVPGMLHFTRRGFMQGKKHWSGLLHDMRDKTVVITGATSGLGKAATLALAEMGANIIAVVRDKTKAAQLEQDVRHRCDRSLQFMYADMNSLEQTRAAAQTLLQNTAHVDVLINNAGALFNERQITAEGFEKSLALLLLSPFLMTETLLPLLRRSEQGRVINVVSGGLYTQAIRLDDMQYEKEPYNGPKAYARAKRGLLDMTRFWAAQAENATVTFHAMHPGWADTQAVQDSLPTFYRLTKPFLRNAAQGADTIVWLASAPEPVTCNGQFWLDRAIHTSAMVPGTETPAEQRQTLYTCLQQMTGV